VTLPSDPPKLALEISKTILSYKINPAPYYITNYIKENTNKYYRKPY
jgi:hypothetical protein